MAIEVFWGSGSPYAWRVLLALELKHLPWESHVLQFDRGDLKKPEFLALNPRGKVPVLRDGDVVIAESLGILAYLDRAHPEPPLFGRTPAEAGRIWQAISEVTSYVQEPFRTLFRWMFGSGARTPEVDAALALITPELTSLDARLATSPWLGGSAPCAADLVWFPIPRTLMRAASRFPDRVGELGLTPLADKLPHVAAWIARVEALPGYDRTFPPHWR